MESNDLIYDSSKSPFFSFVVPTYNSANTLQECLYSILNQTYQNFEVLIIDGKSNDNTLSIAKMSNDARIRIFSEADNGIYDAMNKGIKLAKGEWLYFLGSDDKLYSNFILDRIYDYVSGSTLDVVYGNVISDRFKGKYDGEFDYLKLYNQNICHQAILFNKKVFEKIGIFNLKYKSHADYDHNIRWFLNKKIYKLYIEEVIAVYADGGYSSQNDDLVFKNDKNLKFMCLGFFTLPKHFLLQLSNNKSHNIKEFVFYRIVNSSLSVRLFLKNLYFKYFRINNK